MSARTWFVAVALAALPEVACAQDLASRVASVGEGTVRMGYATREGVEVCDQGIRMGDREMMWQGRGRYDVATSCTTGFVQLDIEVRDRIVRDVEILDRRDARVAPALDLGEVTAGEATRYLLSLARGSGARGGLEEAILPAMIADVDDLWRDVLTLARDRAVESDVRKSALFWLGQEAADAATAGIAGVAADEQEEQEVREAAVFALSQRPSEQGIPVLIDLARTAREAETRRSAMFWLAQSGDERVLGFFEEILLGRGPR